MKTPPSRTASMRCLISSSSGAYCALTSTSGIGRTAVQSRGAPPAHDQDETDHDARGDNVLHVAEVVVELRVARAEGIAGPREREAPERRPGDRQHRVEAERLA